MNSAYYVLTGNGVILSLFLTPYFLTKKELSQAIYSLMHGTSLPRSGKFSYSLLADFLTHYFKHTYKLKFVSMLLDALKKFEKTDK